MKIVLNRNFGAFGISKKAREQFGISDEEARNVQFDRRDSRLIEAVETLGEEADGKLACLKVFDIPDENTDYIIINYDGLETIYYVIDGKIIRAD